MKMKWISAGIALSAVLTGCSLAPLKASALTVKSPGPMALPNGSIGSKGPVVGVNLYAISNYTAAQTAAYGTRTLAYIKSTLNASAVDLVWSMYAPRAITSGTCPISRWRSGTTSASTSSAPR